MLYGWQHPKVCLRVPDKIEVKQLPALVVVVQKEGLSYGIYERMSVPDDEEFVDTHDFYRIDLVPLNPLEKEMIKTKEFGVH